MRRFEFDWDYLRQGLGVPATALVLALVILGASAYLRGQFAEKLQSDEARLAVIEQQRNERQGKLDALAESRDTYLQLIADGIVGEENRLAWIQALRGATADMGLPYVRYAAAGQQTFTAPYLVAGLAAPVLVSTVDLQVGAGHEIEVLRLVRRLEDAPGLFHISACDLVRVAENRELSGTRPNLISQCSLDWFTIPPGSQPAT